MTPTESALRLLRLGARVQWPAERDPRQPWLTPAPLERTVREIQGRVIVFDDGTRLALPPDQGLRVGRAPDGKADTLTVLASPHPALTLTVLPAAGAAWRPVRSLADLRERCQAGVWVEVEQNDKAPATRGKVRWAVALDRVDGVPVITFSDRTALPLAKKESDLHFKDGNIVEWKLTEGNFWLEVQKISYVRIRLRDDRPAPAVRAA